MNNSCLYPTICNLCGGEVQYINNSVIYGKQYGSGYCYYCSACGAFVGTHKPRPKEALGVLANSNMRKQKIACHEIFDALWDSPRQRSLLYKALAGAMNISVDECHFGWFDSQQLTEALAILKEWQEKSKRQLKNLMYRQVTQSS